MHPTIFIMLNVSQKWISPEAEIVKQGTSRIFGEGKDRRLVQKGGLHFSANEKRKIFFFKQAEVLHCLWLINAGTVELTEIFRKKRSEQRIPNILPKC